MWIFALNLEIRVDGSDFLVLDKNTARKVSVE